MNQGTQPKGRYRTQLAHPRPPITKKCHRLAALLILVNDQERIPGRSRELPPGVADLRNISTYYRQVLGIYIPVKACCPLYDAPALLQ